MVTFINRKKRLIIIFLAACVLLFCLMVLSSTMGTADISFTEAIKIITGKIPLFKNFIDLRNVEPTHELIVINVRLPRIILAALVGAGLSVVGAAFQGMFKNPMADPYVLGVSSGAALGATVALSGGVIERLMGPGGITLFAFSGAILTAILVYNAARVGNRVSPNTLLLAGVSISYLLSSIVSIIMVFNKDLIQNVVMWTMGSVSTASWKKVAILLPFVVIGSLIVLVFARDLNIMSTGDEAARSLGINVERVKKILLVISSFIVAACVSVSGIIGFVGLIIPHIVRLLTGSDHRAVLPFSIVVGAVFMVVCDTMARNLVSMVTGSPAEIPVGAITAIFGSPYFIYLLIKRKKVM